MKLAFKELKQTEVIHGTRLRFYLLFVYHKLTTRTQKSLPGLHSWLKKRGPQWFQKRLLIKNKIGSFSVGPDDSIAKASPYFEYNLQPWLDEDTRKGIFLDIGANVGFYSLLACTKDYQKVYAFEANPETFKVLQKNIEESNVADVVTPVFGGLGDKTDTLHFAMYKHHTGISKFVTKDEVIENSSDVEYTKVPVQTLDDYIEKNSIDVKDISFIKLDVEGFEYNVLQGMKKTLELLQSGTLLFIEVWDKNEWSQETVQLIQSAGFNAKSTQKQNVLFLKGPTSND